jgi:hypothetical protein
MLAVPFAEHVAAVVVIVGVAIIGFTVTVKVKVAPGHVPDVGVTVYVAVCAVFVVLVNVPMILVAPDPVVPPVKLPVTTGADQL